MPRVSPFRWRTASRRPRGGAHLSVAQGRVTSSLRLHPCPPTAPGAACGILDPEVTFARMQAQVYGGGHHNGSPVRCKQNAERVQASACARFVWGYSPGIPSPRKRGALTSRSAPRSFPATTTSTKWNFNFHFQEVRMRHTCGKLQHLRSVGQHAASPASAPWRDAVAAPTVALPSGVPRGLLARPVRVFGLRLPQSRASAPG